MIYLLLEITSNSKGNFMKFLLNFLDNFTFGKIIHTRSRFYSLYKSPVMFSNLFQSFNKIELKLNLHEKCFFIQLS